MSDIPAPALSRRKKILFVAILATLFLAVAQVVSVWWLKKFNGYDGEHLYQYAFDPYKNILPAPNYVDTRGLEHNSVGFRRTGEVSVEKPPGTYRIFLMGGSTAYGLGGLWPHIQTEFAVYPNSETIDAHLQRILSDSIPGAQVEVINAAVTNYWTHHELIYLNQTILKYDPDMVLLMDGVNDFYQADPRHDQFASFGNELPAPLVMGEPTLKALFTANTWWAFRKSALVNVMSRGARTVKLLFAPRRSDEPLDVDQAMATLQDVFPRNALKMWRRSGLILRDEGIKTVFMLQPMLILERHRLEIMPPIEREMFEFNINASRPGYEPYATRAVEFVRPLAASMAGDVGADFLDLTDLYRGVEGQIFTDYVHLTPHANRILAERVASAILPSVRGGSTEHVSPAALSGASAQSPPPNLRAGGDRD